MKHMKASPCDDCRRVANPKACDNKDCKQWRKWFLFRWEQLRRRYLVREDPCARCSLARELCFEPCWQKREWEGAERE